MLAHNDIVRGTRRGVRRSVGIHSTPDAPRVPGNFLLDELAGRQPPAATDVQHHAGRSLIKLAISKRGFW
jgi:hypothetical protein